MNKKVIIGFKDNKGIVSYKNKTVYPFHDEIHGHELFYQEKPKFVSDLRINNPKVGIILDGVFFVISGYEYFRDHRDHFEKHFQYAIEKCQEMITETKLAKKEGRFLPSRG